MSLSSVRHVVESNGSLLLCNLLGVPSQHTHTHTTWTLVHVIEPRSDLNFYSEDEFWFCKRFAFVLFSQVVVFVPPQLFVLLFPSKYPPQL